MFTNSLIRAGNKQVFYQQFYTQEELQYFIDNFDDYTEDQLETLSLSSDENINT